MQGGVAPLFFSLLSRRAWTLYPLLSSYASICLLCSSCLRFLFATLGMFMFYGGFLFPGVYLPHILFIRCVFKVILCHFPMVPLFWWTFFSFFVHFWLLSAQLFLLWFDNHFLDLSVVYYWRFSFMYDDLILLFLTMFAVEFPLLKILFQACLLGGMLWIQVVCNGLIVQSCFLVSRCHFLLW